MITALLIASAYPAVGIVVALALAGASNDRTTLRELAFFSIAWPAPVLIGLGMMLGLVD